MTYSKPAKTKIICLLLSIVMILSFFGNWSFDTEAYTGNDITVTITDHDNVVHTAASVGFTFDFSGLKKNGTVLTGNESIADGDTLEFKLEWDAGSFTTPTNDDRSTFTVVFNNLLTKHADLATVNLHNVAGTGCNADFVLDPATGVMTVTVRPDGLQEHFRGDCNVSLTVHVDTASLEDNKFEFSPLFKGLKFNYGTPFLNTEKGTMGGIYEQDGKYYQNFYSKLSVSNGTVTNVAVTDTYGSLYTGVPAGMFYSNDWVENAIPTNGTAAAVTPGANSFTANFAALTGETRIVYALEIDPTKLSDAISANALGDSSAITNKLNATYSNGVNDNIPAAERTAQTTVYAPYIDKSGVLNSTDKNIKWTITFYPNTLGKVFDASALTVTDTPGGELRLSDVKNALTAAGIAYTEEGSSLKISGAAFAKEGDNYTLSYTTPVGTEYFLERDASYFNNTAKADYKGFTPDKTSSVRVSNTGTIGETAKTVQSADTDALTITWKLDVDIPDPAAETVDSLTIEDTAVNGYWDGDISQNVSIAAVLMSGVNDSSFSYSVDGTAVSPADMAAYMSEIQYYYNYGSYCGWKSEGFDADKDYGFKFRLNNTFVNTYGGKKLTIAYTTKMGGDTTGNYSSDKNAYLKYVNKAATTYYNGAAALEPKAYAEAEFKPAVSAKKIGYTYGTPGIYSDYGTGGDYPVLAFWEIKLKSDEDLTAGQVLTVKDRVSTGHSYYNGSVRLVTNGQSFDNGSFTWIPGISDANNFTSLITAVPNGSQTEFRITVTDALAAAAKTCGNTLNIVYATAADEKTSRKIYFGESVKVTNQADVYSDDILQVKDIQSSQELTAPAGVLDKTQAVTKGSDSEAFGKVTYTVIVNKYAADLSSGDKIVVDDWLGGNLENPTSVTITRQLMYSWGATYDDPAYAPVVYTVQKNPAYSSVDGTIHSFFLLGGVPVSDSAIYKTGVGKKMTFTLDDEVCYKISYTLDYQKTSDYFEEIEAEARYTNTAVIRSDDGSSISKSVVINTDNYHVQAGVSAGTMQNFIIFDIKKMWSSDFGKKRPESIKLHVTRNNLTNPSETPFRYDQVITVNDNAVELADGSWLFALKLLALTEVDGVTTRYSYTIDEASIDGYKAQWSQPLTDIALPANKDGLVVSSRLTNTGTARFAVRKTDITGLDEISGASLAIYRASDVDAAGVPKSGAVAVDSWVSDGTEHICAPGAGDYVLIETGNVFYDAKTDKNYNVTASKVYFTVDGSGVTSVTGQNSGTVTASDRENGYITYTAASYDSMAEFTVCDAVSPLLTAKLRVNKYDSSGANALFGANAAVYAKSDIGADGRPKSGAIPADSWTTAGETHTVGLTDGEYVLVETGASFTDTASGIRYKVTDASFAFTVAGGAITAAAVTPSASSNGKMIFNDTDTLNIYDDKVEKIRITKTDATGNTEVEGAQLQLFDSLGVQIGYTYTSSASEKWEVGPLDKGAYTIRETVAPDGYALTATDVTFTVDDYGKVTSVSGSGELRSGVVLVKDTLSLINITKTDMDGNAIAGAATFKLTITETGKDLKGVMLGTDVLGEVTFVTYTGNSAQFTGLKDGTYTLEELTAPEGYYTVGTISFTVENGVVSAVAKAGGSGAVARTSDGGIIVRDAPKTSPETPEIPETTTTTTKPVIPHIPDIVTSAVTTTTVPGGPVAPSDVTTYSPSGTTGGGETTLPAGTAGPGETTLPVDTTAPAGNGAEEAVTSRPDETAAPGESAAPGETTAPGKTAPEDEEDVIENSIKPEKTTAPDKSSEKPEKISSVDSSEDTTVESSETVTSDSRTVTSTPGDTGTMTDSAEENPNTGSRALACGTMLLPEIAVIFAARKKNKDSDEDEE